jgi:hypothetical protein
MIERVLFLIIFYVNRTLLKTKKVAQNERLIKDERPGSLRLHSV